MNHPDGETIALAPVTDPRIIAIAEAFPVFAELLGRFTSAFAERLCPMTIILRRDVADRLRETDAVQGFRDILVLCSVPRARALCILHKNNPGRITYSNSFWLYPWSLARDNKHIVCSTFALNGLHVVDEFHAQSSPEIPLLHMGDIDRPLFAALMKCWKRHFLGKRQSWRDRALFRSLNMAAQASQIPAGVGTTPYDVGRQVALWVSAFEILLHPRTGDANVRTIITHFETASYNDRSLARRRFVAYTNVSKGRRLPQRVSLPAWLYAHLYNARCAFLHGNPLNKKILRPKGLTQNLFWIAPVLYCLALASFLGLSIKHARKSLIYAEYFGRSLDNTIERALLRVRK